MKTYTFSSVVMLCMTTLFTSAQSSFRDFTDAVDATLDAAQSSFRDFTDAVDATLDAARESREQNAAATDVRAIFAKAKAAAEEDDKLNLCGFYTGMSAADAQTLVGHYALKDGEWSIEGDPVYTIYLSLKGVRRVTKGGNTFDELAQAVANRVGSLEQNWKTKDYSLKTIDGISVTMSESSGFTMFDTEAMAAAERKAREEREREAAERKSKEAAKSAALALKSKKVSISDSLVIELQSVPGNLWFGKYEVTQAQWEAVMGENPSRFKGSDHPVEKVSWVDCQEFLKKLNEFPAVTWSGLTFRLPTAEEWEVACRAGSMGEYCRLADETEITEDTLGNVAWFEDNSDGKTHSVGLKQMNAFGLYDMHGNVCEWTSTADGEDRVYRGGSWGNSSVRCMSSSRGRSSPSNRYQNLGFRLCASGKDSSMLIQNSEPKSASKTKDNSDISDILAKAENHDGIVIVGLYLGMSIDDAKRVAAHALGAGFSTTDWNRSNRNEYYWDYYIGNTDENEIALNVLKKNNRVVGISFGPRVIRKLINSQNPVSIDNLGRRFFSHFGLEWGPSSDGWHYDFGLRGGAMETPEGEVIGYDPREGGRIGWYYVKEPPELKP